MSRRDLRLCWFALRHRSRPSWLLPVSLLLVWYALNPLNLAIPVLGVVDDALLLPLILHFILRLLPAAIHAEFDRPAG